ncbi:unnamed protein product [Pleuronectes platessa]|uniref:Uncharacterized protein n=1 Tax=Pleuronectes platessa TaxID=8262 RepID=A0A9N7V0E7_PLEPL|nr:unnamed protein product [Pleuronectes platessa]
MGPTSLLATQLCKHPTTEHRPQVCQANQRAGRMRKGGTSKPMSQLLGAGRWKETQRESGEWRKQVVKVWKDLSKEGKQRIERRDSFKESKGKNGSGRDLAVFLQHTEDRPGGGGGGGGGGGRQIYMVRTALAALEQHTGLQ